MQIAGTQPNFPVADAIAGPSLLPAVDDISRRVATPSMAELPPATDLRHVQERIRQANEAIKAGNENLQFHLDTSASDARVQLVDSSSGQTLSDFPPDRFIAMLDKLQNVSGLHVNFSQ